MNQQQKVRSITMLIFFWLFSLFSCSGAMAALGCYDCHGTRSTQDSRPRDATSRDSSIGGIKGNHRTHLPATADKSNCEVCHPGSSHYTSSHQNRNISLSHNLNNSPVTALYKNRTSAFPQTSTPTLGSCSNVNCHFESESTALTWGSSYLAAPGGCNVCHGAPPADGSHPAAAGSGKKHGDYYTTDTRSCSKCHVDHLAEASPFGHASSASKRGLIVRFSQAGGFGRYSGNVAYPDYLPSQQPSRNGTCLNVACHFNAPATWGGSLDCKGCHGNSPAPAFPSQAGEPNHANTGVGTTNANSHEKHAKGGATSCGACHADTTATGTAIKAGSTLHVNNAADVTFDSGKAGTGATWTAQTMTCSNISCHGAGTPRWGGTLDCKGCHGNEPAPAFTSQAGEPNYSNAGAGASKANSHEKHTKAGAASCDTCHTGTTTTGTTIKAGSTLHVNTVEDVTFNGAKAGATATWTAATKTCSNISCHITGSPRWGATLDCKGCHGNDLAPAFVSQAGEPNYANTGAGSSKANSHQQHVKTGAASCDACHTGTTITGTTIVSGSTLHVNSANDVTFNATKAGAAAWTAATKTCSNISCHNGSSAQWGGSLLSDCTGCHGNDAASAVPMATGQHASHINNAAVFGQNNDFGCIECHASTVSGNRTIGNLSNHGSGLKNYSGAKAGRVAVTGSGTCSTVYCHSTGMKTNQFRNMSAANWYSSRTLSCNGCHGAAKLPDGTFAAFTSVAGEPNYTNMTGMGQRNSHLKHVLQSGITTSTGCANCHSTTVDASVAGRLRSYSTSHLNRVRDVAFSATIQGRYSSTTQQCMNTYCHGTAGTPRWGSASLACNDCHEANSALGGAHGKHWTSETVATSYTGTSGNKDTTGATYQFECVSCHTAPASHANGVADKPSGAVAQVYFGYTTAGKKGGYQYGTSSTPDSRGFRFTSGADQACSNTYCHSDGKGGNPNQTTFAWTSANGTLGDDCSGCHGGSAASRRPMATDAHFKHISSYPFACQKCHDRTVTGSRTITDKFYHVNKSRDVALKKVVDVVGVPNSYDSQTQVCATYCHSDGMNITPPRPLQTMQWSGTKKTQCYSCHLGRTKDNTPANCAQVNGTWDYANGICAPFLTMTSNGHKRLVGPQWIRKYPCSYCHYATVKAVTDANGKILRDDGDAIYKANHVNGTKNVVMAPQWAIVGLPAPSYDPNGQVCKNVYCHSDGTTAPPSVRPFGWGQGKTECNTCHGHPNGECSTADCHDGRIDAFGRSWPVKTGWKSGEEWKAAIPMFKNEGPGTARANSHGRHTETTFTCDQCHESTTINGSCTDCHIVGIPSGKMNETAHLNAEFHANKSKDVTFKGTGSYNSVTKTCSNTSCHLGGTDPVWGGSVNDSVVCKSCHGTTEGDVDTFGAFQPEGPRTKINMTEWVTTGHGRPTSSGPYPQTGNPAANFPGNPCWYCHDNNVLHQDRSNPFRLRQHPQFSKRFDKECGYCHMEGKDSECLGCHYASQSLGHQLTEPAIQAKHGNAVVTSGCRAVACHDTDARLHKSGSPFWTPAQNADVKNQYMMMGVCLQCHDDDSGGTCTSCHTPPENSPYKYSLGFDPGTGFIKPSKARASTVHFGYKHYKGYESNGIWKGGKFCWDCHDPHGDSNIFMIQKKVATATDGTFGVPTDRAEVVFTRKQSGLDYVRTSYPYNGICNVCHSAGSQHFRSDGGDGHNVSRPCTKCHEHRFGDSHADNKACNSCHQNKPVPRHSGFGLPRDCVKCHEGTVGKRMDVMGQFGGTSHHVQGVPVTNKQCYPCHWESTPDGLIDIRYHEGYNFKNHTTVKNAKVDLVVYGAGVRPTTYKQYTTAVEFLASNVGTVYERTESAKVSTHCLSCHNDKNNSSQPFGDCKTPRQYAWDRQSIEGRYGTKATTTWGKYGSNGKQGVVKALSAHGNAVANNGGGGSFDGTIANTRGGTGNVECFDCHSSHGSKLVGVTSSYVTFNGTYNGGNLKETQAGKGGYSMSYKATSNSTAGAPNPYNAGAGQCFDCHLTQNQGTTPWGYQSTFGATAPIKGYYDSDKFGTGVNGSETTYPYKAKTMKAGHFKASSPLASTATGTINGLCTPCHDPHGVSPTLGTAKQAYAVPLLKGTWMTTPSKEDAADPNVGGGYAQHVNIENINEPDDKFAGLCLRCHQKGTLTDGANKNTAWKSIDRVHESVKGWGANSQHSYACSKCHAPHVSGLPRLMVTNCLDHRHRGRVTSGGYAGSGSDSDKYGYEHYEGPGEGSGSFPLGGGQYGVNCHPDGAWPNNYWNVKTPWVK